MLYIDLTMIFRCQIIAFMWTSCLLCMSCDKKEHKISHAINSSPHTQEKNIELGNLKVCGLNPMTGYYRNGSCFSDEDDIGVHTVCAVMTQEFLLYAMRNGNDLMTPKRNSSFPGLKPGDKWCICADWWNAAEPEGKAPPVDLEATHAKTLWVIDKAKMQMYALNQ